MPGSPSPTSFRPRPGGGFNSGAGAFGEHLDESALRQAVNQKQQTQQTAQLNPSLGAASQQQRTQQQAGTQTPPREVASIGEEFQRAGKDIVTGVADFFNPYKWLGIEDHQLDPQELAKTKQHLQAFNQINQEYQAEVKRRTQERIQKEKAAREQEEQRKHQAEQARQQQVVVPTTPERGPKGPGGSRKQKRDYQLQQNRKPLSGPQGAN